MPKIKVLVVFANPRNTDRLRLEAEDRAIQHAIRRGRYRDNIEVTRCHAATIHDVRQSLLDEAFQIVHISGHGSNTGLVLEDDAGNENIIPQKALAALFKVYSPPLQCVILNACYSISQGKLISLGVPFTIAMEGPVDDEAAIEFSRGFYDAIGAGRSIDFAYGEGQRTVALAVSDAQFISKMLRKRGKYLPGSEEFPFDEGVLALLNLQKEKCRRKHVAVNTSHLLLALLEIHNGVAERALDTLRPDLATQLHSQLEQYIVQLPSMSGVKPYSKNFRWEDLPAVQKAWQWAQKDGGKKVTEKHLLLGILGAEESATLQSLRRRLGNDLPRLVQIVQDIPDEAPGTPGIDTFLQ